ncbi:MAG: prolipoprotein diacylglyceryl transferase [Alphaproteobacteria bacterium]|nr:prolipoprotein diacylglyceryl transferase [Alphaproteobacteria bacterium]
MNTGLAFPDISPIAFSFGFIVVRWYALAYIFGILLAWGLVTKMRQQEDFFSTKQLDDFVAYAVISILLGGRLGYVLFYHFSHYLQHPLEILFLWQGGMSFHGALLAFIGMLIWFCKKEKLPFLKFSDMIATVAPVGLFLGRLANFVNGELYGRATSVPWGIRFPSGGEIARHPSQLYEACLEGFFLFILLNLLWWKFPKIREKQGFFSGLFLSVYAIVRFGIEYFREPDAQIGFIFSVLTMGQILCLPMLLIGLVLIYISFRGSKNENQ